MKRRNSICLGVSTCASSTVVDQDTLCALVFIEIGGAVEGLHVPVLGLDVRVRVCLVGGAVEGLEVANVVLTFLTVFVFRFSLAVDLALEVIAIAALSVDFFCNPGADAGAGAFAFSFPFLFDASVLLIPLTSDDASFLVNGFLFLTRLSVFTSLGSRSRPLLSLVPLPVPDSVDTVDTVDADATEEGVIGLGLSLDPRRVV